jgi:hypothetical protein
VWSACVSTFYRHGQSLIAHALFRRMQQAGYTNGDGGGT